MAYAILIIFFAFSCICPSSATVTRGSMMESIVSCCTEGRDIARMHENCDNSRQILSAGIIPNHRSKPVCIYVGSVCCENKLKDIQCTHGIEKARLDGVCADPPTDDYSKCCEMCKMGIIVAREKESCEPKVLASGQLWESAFLQCCNVEKTPLKHSEEQKETDVRIAVTTTTTPASNAEGARNICELWPGELCAQGCTPIGNSYECYCYPGYKLMSDGKSCSPQSSPGRCEDCEDERPTNSCNGTESGDNCICPAGFHLASDNKTCIEGHSSGYTYDCPAGYQAKQVEGHQWCYDINECTEGTSACDPETERCINTIGSYTCLQTAAKVKCKRGFQYNEYRMECEDVNECSDTEDPPCASNQECTNTVGSYTCSCKTGFNQDPLTLACMDINECQQRLHNCGQFQRCDNTLGSYICVRDINCGTGYTLNSYTGACEDDDECALGTDTCRTNGMECRNTIGSFRCVKKKNTTMLTTPSTTRRATIRTTTTTTTYRPYSPPTQLFPTHVSPAHPCPPGFKFVGNHCVDIDECKEGTASCGPDQLCKNIIGNYLCGKIPSCPLGYKLHTDKRTCIDIDECSETEGLCTQKCLNRWGSYRCSCDPGYTLASDNRTCIDINECELGKPCQGYCLNLPGSFTCQCPPGYRLHGNHHSCIDIDECYESNNLCDNDNEVCVNVHGEYRCASVSCPPGFRRDPEKTTKCLRNIVCSWEEDCYRQPLTWSFLFFSIVSNRTLPDEGETLVSITSRYPASVTDYTYEVKQVKAPPGVPAATRANFYLKKVDGKAYMVLLKPLIGPQEIHLEIRAEYVARIKQPGASIHNVEIFVSQYPY